MIKLTDISKLLNEETLHIDELCKSDSINKWSFHKPINSPKLKGLYDADFYSVNDGFNLHTWSTWYQCLNNRSYDWSYVDRTAPFRMGDFIGYNSYSQPWFRMDCAQGSTVYADSNANIFFDDDIQSFVNTYAVFSGAPDSNVDLVYIIIDNDSNSKYLYKFSAVEWLADYNSYYLPINSNFIIGRSYTVVPMLTTATQQWSDRRMDSLREDSDLYGSWWNFPLTSQVSFTVVERPQPPTPSQYISIEIFNMEYTWNDPILTEITFDVRMTISGTITDNVTVSADIYFDNTATPVKLGTCSATLNINNNPTAVSHINYRDDITTMTSGNLDDRIPLRIEASYNRNGNITHNSYTENVERQNV